MHLNNTEAMDFDKDITGEIQEYAHAIKVERTLHTMQKDLSNTLDPKQAAMKVFRVAIEFYDADWCGIIDVDTEVGVWTPLWWVNRDFGEMARTNFKEFELLEEYVRWLSCLQGHEAVIIPDTDVIQNEFPTEYALYQRLNAKSILAVPFWKGPKGFLVLRNAKRNNTNPTMLRLLNFAIVSLLNEYFLLESRKLTIMSPRITNDTDVYISLFGELKITTNGGVLTETEMKSPKMARLLVYLLLSRKSGCSPREIVDTLWSDEDVDNAVKNIKNLIYRLQQTFSLISKHRLIVSTPNGYQLNPALNIITDYQLFEKKWTIAAKSTDIDEKIDYLKKAVDLYHGALFRTARSEHWLMPTATSYEMRFIGTVSELLKCLYEIGDYVGIQQYATKALRVCPHSVDVYYWMIVTLYRLKHSEMAKGELRMAQTNLLAEEYRELAERLDKEIQSILHPHNTVM